LAAIQGTEKFSRILLRPDGSLPAFGNTLAGTNNTLTVIPDAGMGKLKKFAAPFSQPPEMAGLFPVSGYALWWSQSPVPAQAVVAWAIHLRHGHKHADEPSLHFWSRGYNWITATGYWPYGHRGFDEANGWAGSNAPHALKEPANSPREARLLGVGNDGPLRIADVEVCRRAGMCVRRQVLQLSAEQFIVVDDISNSKSGTEILWTTDPRLSLRQIDKLSFVSSAIETGHELHIEMASDAGLEVALLRGSEAPFAGWVVSHDSPQPSDAIRVLHRNRNVAMATLIEITESPSKLSLQSFTRRDDDDWRISLRQSGGGMMVERKGRNVSVARPNETFSMRVNEPPDLAERQVALRSAMSQAIDRFPPWRDLSAYHFRLYLMIVLLWVVIEIGIVAVPSGLREAPRLQLIPTAAWILLAAWIHYCYLV